MLSSRKIVEKLRSNNDSYLKLLTPDVVDYYLFNHYLAHPLIRGHYEATVVALELVTDKIVYCVDKDYLVLFDPDQTGHHYCWVYRIDDYQLLNKWSVQDLVDSLEVVNSYVVDITKRIITLAIYGKDRESDGTLQWVCRS